MVTTYECNIPLYHISDDKINPSHEWFHAMDPDTYEPQNNSYQSTLCRDEACLNYYRKLLSYQCRDPRHTIQHPSPLWKPEPIARL